MSEVNTHANDDTPAPEAEAPHLPAQSRRLELWLPLTVVIVDQLTKTLVRATLPIHDSVTIVPGLVDFTHVRNTGAAFGILNYSEFPFKTVVIALIATAALVGVGMYAAPMTCTPFAERW